MQEKNSKAHHYYYYLIKMANHVYPFTYLFIVSCILHVMLDRLLTCQKYCVSVQTDIKFSVFA